jgi:hypothetical protein
MEIKKKSGGRLKFKTNKIVLLERLKIYTVK